MLRNLARAQLSYASRLTSRSITHSASRTIRFTSQNASKTGCLFVRSPSIHRVASIPSTRRFKSSKAVKTESIEETLGDEPPLYDGKPAWWARWAYALVALDVLFTYVSYLSSFFFAFLSGCLRRHELHPSSISVL